MVSTRTILNLRLVGRRFIAYRTLGQPGIHFGGQTDVKSVAICVRDWAWVLLVFEDADDVTADLLVERKRSFGIGQGPRPNK
jgi:hypothetical protein